MILNLIKQQQKKTIIKTMKLPSIVITTLALVTNVIVVCEQVSENSTNICERCKCKEIENAQTLILDCKNQNIQHVLSNWPPHKDKLIATFTQNNISTLNMLPGSDAEIELVYSNCSIQYLSPGFMQSVKNIKFLDLSYNLLTREQLSEDVFEGPYNDTVMQPLGLETLDLSYNQIHSLARNLFSHLPDLKTLNLEGNQFVVLDLHTQLAISSSQQLMSLNLANNGLSELIDDAIYGLNLTELNLAKNDIDFVPETLHHIGATLEILVLDHNPIIEFNEESFLGLHNILDLSANNLTKLTYINANTFVPLEKLKKLSLNNNFVLTEIAREAFGLNQTLQEFYLNNNRLYNIDCKLLDWSKLQTFQFYNNPMDCSCDLYNISKSLPSQITSVGNGPLCYDPRTSSSIEVFYLQSDICSFKPYRVIGTRYVTHHFTVLRITLVALSVVLLFAIFIATALAITRLRKLKRNRNYPFASQVLYNPLTTSPRF